MTTKDQLRAAQEEIAALRARLDPAAAQPAPAEALATPPLVPPKAPNGSGVAQTVQEPAARPKTRQKPVTQPRAFLGVRTKLAPMPKRQPFTFPGEPGKK